LAPGSAAALLGLVSRSIPWGLLENSLTNAHAVRKPDPKEVVLLSKNNECNHNDKRYFTSDKNDMICSRLDLRSRCFQGIRELMLLFPK
jgi:hypothetical protein